MFKFTAASFRVISHICWRKIISLADAMRAKKSKTNLFACASLSNGESNQQKKNENPEKFTACTHKLNRDSEPTSSQRKTTNIIPIRIVSSQNVKIIQKNSLHTHKKNMNRIEFHIYKSSYDHEKKMIARIIREIRIQIFWASVAICLVYGNMLEKLKREKKSTKKNTDTACVHSSDSDQINSLVSGFNLWSLRHTVALVLILIEDITFHYRVWCREIVLHRILDSK